MSPADAGAAYRGGEPDHAPVPAPVTLLRPKAASPADCRAGEPGVSGEAGPTCRAASAGRPEHRSTRSPQAASEAAATRRDTTQQQQEQPAGADQLAEAAAGLSLEPPAGGEAKARAKAPAGAAELADALPHGNRDKGHSACPPHGAKVRHVQALICARWQPREGSSVWLGGQCARAGASS